MKPSLMLGAAIVGLGLLLGVSQSSAKTTAEPSGTPSGAPSGPPKRKPAPKPRKGMPYFKREKRVAKYDGRSPAFDRIGKNRGVPPNLLRAIAEQESGFNALAVNDNLTEDKTWITSTDWGLMQLNDFALRFLKMSPEDAYIPERAIDGAARWLVQLRAELKSRKAFTLTNWAASYNTGSNLKPEDKARAYSSAVVARWREWDRRIPA